MTRILPANSSSLFSDHHLIIHNKSRLPIHRYALQVALQPYTRRAASCRLAVAANTTASTATLIKTINSTTTSTSISQLTPKLGKRWKEYQGVNHWDGLLDPLDDDLRAEILRYGQFVEAAYHSFDFDPSSPTYATCKFSRSSLLTHSGLDQTGYRVTKFIRATCGLQLPRWINNRGPSWASARSSWIGYVAVCQDKEQIQRLGRRDVVIAFRGTATCMEWLENLRATLTCVDHGGGGGGDDSNGGGGDDAPPMVESGFLSMYTSSTATCPSMQSTVKAEVARILDTYGGDDDVPLSFTITGHSLGAALATLAAHDISSTMEEEEAPAAMVTVMSFGGPRVGNRSFRRQLEKGGARILRIVNSDDIITKVPGFVIGNSNGNSTGGELPRWIKKRVEDTAWVYDEVGKELRLSSKESPYLNKRDVATCHELSTYLLLVNGFVSSTCPFRATARKMFNEHRMEKLGYFT